MTTSAPTATEEPLDEGHSCACGCTPVEEPQPVTVSEPDDLADVDVDSYPSGCHCTDDDAERAEPAKPAKGTRSGPEEQRMQGHWLMAKMGKRVLRPGGMEMTRMLLNAAPPTSADRIVEFGPGVGRTAQLLLKARPAAYTGVDPNPEGTPQLMKILKRSPQANLVVANAMDTTLPDASATLVIGEAMLSMHNSQEKEAIMREAFRILAPGGRYFIHELGFMPDDCPEEVQTRVSKLLSRSIKVGARPLTTGGWRELLEGVGFEVESEHRNPMILLERQRIIADEGFFRGMRFLRNVRRHPVARERIAAMRHAFRESRPNLTAIGFVLRKPQ